MERLRAENPCPCINTVKTMKYGPENPETIKLAAQAEKTARQNKSGLWKRVAQALNARRRSRAEVNLYKLDNVTKEGETALVLGKVLGVGSISHSLTVAALDASKKAVEAINQKGKYISLSQLMKDNPSGKGVRIVK